MTSLADAITSRRSVRVYSDQEVSDEVLDRVVSLALEAPSAFNLQARDLVVIRDAATREALSASSGQPQFAAAPVVLVAVARVEEVPEDLSEIIPDAGRAEWVAKVRKGMNQAQLREAAMKDTMLMAGFALVAAAAEGLATSATTGWDEEEVKKIIGLEGRADRAVALVTALGYPAESPEHPGRLASRRVSERYI